MAISACKLWCFLPGALPAGNLLPMGRARCSPRRRRGVGGYLAKRHAFFAGLAARRPAPDCATATGAADATDGAEPARFIHASNAGTRVLALRETMLARERCLLVTGYQDFLSALAILVERRPGLSEEPPGTVRLLFGTNTGTTRAFARSHRPPARGGATTLSRPLGTRARARGRPRRRARARCDLVGPPLGDAARQPDARCTARLLRAARLDRRVSWSR